MYPDLLIPSSVQPFTFFPNLKVLIPKVNLVFKRFADMPFEITYNKKPVIDFNGERVFAEIAILRIFQNDGWDGVWVDSSRRKYRIGYWTENAIVKLQEDKQKLLEDIYDIAGIKTGCWDVFCWKGKRVVFTDSRRKNDKFRHTEIKWLKAALKYGLKEDSFLIAEWSLLKG